MTKTRVVFLLEDVLEDLALAMEILEDKGLLENDDLVKLNEDVIPTIREWMSKDTL